MSQPSPLWYATRGAGIATLMLLTAAVVLGIVTSVRWKSEDWPRFLVAALHRNISLFVIVFGVVHVITAIADPITSLGLKALVPFASDYRPLWLGIGVISADLLLAIVATSLLRDRLGYVAWRVVHWLTYASWPLAMLHSLGTGTDPHSGWFMLVAAGCTVSILAALFWRINQGLGEHPNLRLLAQGACAAGALVLVVWTAGGPLQAGWARAAGTPSYLLASNGATPGSASAVLAPGVVDQLQGSLSQARDGTLQVSLSDMQNPALQITLNVAGQGAGQASLTATQNGTPICQAPARVAVAVTAQCGQTQVTITLQRADGRSNAIVGELTTEAA
ncbi:MAG TPA: ferric reductase-like transmembrane domain-containing protein [Chloroflexota bacterium]|nr:ferric reductase-like transmembrane domain-containing protein [Chloroflexota bacterium]